MARRLEAMGQEKYKGTAERRGKVDVFTGRINTDEKSLEIPLKWKKPRRIFVNSMSDLFHEDVPFDFIDRVFAVMALTPWHTFQVLTKRPERMVEYLASINKRRRGYIHEHRGLLIDALSTVLAAEVIQSAWHRMKVFEHGPEPAASIGDATAWSWPLPNVWVGTSVEDQTRADERIPHLLKVPAAVRFISAEPLLGAVDLADLDHGEEIPVPLRLHWVIAGGESGPHARPMHPDWARSLRDQCAAAGVAFFMKQMDKKQPIPTDLYIRQFPEVTHA